MALKQPRCVFYGQCRCCLKDAPLKNMWQNYSTSETEQEIYGKMLVDCFSLSWTIFKKAEDDKICENCIFKLREAISFKDQVNKSQQILLKQMRADTATLNKLKRHMMGDAKDFEVEYLDEEILEIETENTKKYNDRDDEPKLKRSRKNVSFEDNVNNNSFEVSRRYIDGQQKIHSDSNNENYPEIIKQELMEKHRENIRSILIASNATPIKGFWGNTYCCCYCNEKFEHPKELKNHTYTHEDMPFKLKIKDLTKHVIKLDVSFLKCNMCDNEIASLEELMVHVKEDHNMPIHLDIPDHIIPFKFEEENKFICTKCPSEFNSFKDINEHMTDTHCRNYECTKCNRGFVNITSLQTHCMVHRICVHPCSFCPQVFETSAKVKEHEILVHVTAYLTQKCSFCNDTFMNEKDRLRHENEVHKQLRAAEIAQSILREISTENEEIKIEDSKENIEYVEDEQSQSSVDEGNVENRMTNEIVERNDLEENSNEMVGFEIAVEDKVIYKCSDCDKEFDEKFQLLSHMGTHERNKRKHICPSCFKVYFSQYALNDHLKRIHNIKKYFNACELCDKKFRTEQNYMIHMRCIHGLV